MNRAQQPFIAVPFMGRIDKKQIRALAKFSLTGNKKNNKDYIWTYSSAMKKTALLTLFLISIFTLVNAQLKLSTRKKMRMMK